MRITATDPTATEAGETSGAVTVERTSLLNGDVDVTVRVTTSSTATSGTDFPPIPATIRIRDGEPTGTLLVFPTDDDVAEGDETVTIEIVEAGGYLIGDPSEATVTIIDDDGDPSPPVSSSSPGRVLDTRSSGETVDGEFQATGPREAGSTLTLPVAGRAGVSPDATAAVVNVTAVGPEGRGFVTIFPCDERPLTSSLNYDRAGAVVGNEVIVKLSHEGAVCIYTSAATHLTADVVGDVPATSPFVSLEPKRLLDTRAGGETIDGEAQQTGALAAAEPFELVVAGRGGVDADAESAVINLTAINPGGRGFVTVYPCDEVPLASSLNFGAAGAVVGNELIAKLSPRGTVCLSASVAVDVTVDVSGYFPAGTAAASVRSGSIARQSLDRPDR